MRVCQRCSIAVVIACVMVSWEEEGGGSWEEVGGGEAKGAVWEFVGWVMRSTACPR